MPSKRKAAATKSVAAKAQKKDKASPSKAKAASAETKDEDDGVFGVIIEAW
jgi:hypothetical protein